MKNLLLKSLGLLQKNIPLSHLIQRTQKKILLPFYHTVSSKKLLHIEDQLYLVRNPATFEQDLNFFCQHYQPISIQELDKIIQQRKPIDTPVFHLTFDDGLREIYEEVLPILQKKKVPATVFINTDFVDNKALFYRYKVSLIVNVLKEWNEEGYIIKRTENPLFFPFSRKKDLIDYLYLLSHKDMDYIDKTCQVVGVNVKAYLKIKQPYLSLEEIKELRNHNISIGSHGTNHQWFKHLDQKAQERQIIESFEFMKKELQIQKHYFSFPFSDEGVSSDFFDWFSIDFQGDLSFGISGLKDDKTPYHLHRIPMEKSLESAEKIVKTEYLYYLLRKLFNKHQLARR